MVVLNQEVPQRLCPLMQSNDDTDGPGAAELDPSARRDSRAATNQCTAGGYAPQREAFITCKHPYLYPFYEASGIRRSA